MFGRSLKAGVHPAPLPHADLRPLTPDLVSIAANEPAAATLVHQNAGKKKKKAHLCSLPFLKIVFHPLERARDLAATLTWLGLFLLGDISVFTWSLFLVFLSVNLFFCRCPRTPAAPPPSWLLQPPWLSLCTLEGVGLTGRQSGAPPPECRPPPASLHPPAPPTTHRLCLQAFNAQLLCLLVLQFSPSPSPLQVLFICPVSSPPPFRTRPPPYPPSPPVRCVFALRRTGGLG